jgi:outer membrane protein OmpA-like peptidoglycan-associated protein
MKYVILATALSLAGPGVASAMTGPAGQDPADSETPAPASASETSNQPAASNETATSNQMSNQAAADAEVRAKRIESVDLLFDTSSSDLKADARQELVTLARWAKCNEKGALILEGHADPRGTQNYNMKLSAQRAAVVRQKLIAMGVPQDRIVVTVYGKNGPSRGSLAEDRRVTVRATATPVQAKDIVATR